MAAFEATRVVNLVAGDGESFQVPVGAALLSKLVETMFDADAAPEEVQEIPLPNVTKETLQKITEFLTHFYSDSEENKKKVSEIPKVRMTSHYLIVRRGLLESNDSNVFYYDSLY